MQNPPQHESAAGSFQVPSLSAKDANSGQEISVEIRLTAPMSNSVRTHISFRQDTPRVPDAGTASTQASTPGMKLNLPADRGKRKTKALSCTCQKWLVFRIPLLGVFGLHGIIRHYRDQ